MEIEYLCFTVPSFDSSDDIITEGDDENTIWIKTKDKELREKAEKNKICIIFDRITKKFYKEGEEFDIQNKVIFPRSHIQYEEELLTNIEKCGGISIQTMEEHEKIIFWPNFIKPVYRKMVVTTYGEFIEHAENYRENFKGIFIKTAIKSNICHVLKYFGTLDIDGQKLFFTKPPLFRIMEDDMIFLSETFENIEDKENDMNCREYRVFVINNNLLSISRSYVDYETKVPDDVIAFAEKQIKKVSEILDFPNSYVLDIGQVMVDEKEVIDIIEFNPICSSGLEVSNKLVEEIVKRKDKAKQFVKKL